MAIIGGNKWERVTGPNLQPQHAARGNQNRGVLKSQIFQDACKTVGITPNTRQASKFKNGCGLAFKGVK